LGDLLRDLVRNSLKPHTEGGSMRMISPYR
jgi:hypothetical protein